MKTDKKVVTFGEVMMRLIPPGFLRFVQTRSFDVIYAGAEANVAVALANLHVPVDFVTCLPENDLGDACINYIRQFGVNVNNIIRTQDRLGIYFVETGAVYRGNKVIYDRTNSAFANVKPNIFDWSKIFTDTQWFHWTGITPAVSKGAAEACVEAVKKAKEKGLTVSCDLNYRGKLWKWGEPPEKVMSGLLKYVDVLICNEEDAEKVFGIKAPGVDVTKGQIEADRYRFVTEKLKERFPNLQVIAITLRQSINANHNKWSGVLYDGKKLYVSQNYDITHIVDRVGAGDVFAAGLIYMLLHNDDKQKTLDFAVAISCLKHTLYGDSCVIKVDEVEKLMKGMTTGRISR
ncbi:2-dehydro-3-deoxygluconokinase [uncultured archaeon]|nr:2-dehydro-3-deoxygluconokinase [uncultured archaeon]